MESRALERVLGSIQRLFLKLSKAVYWNQNSTSVTFKSLINVVSGLESLKLDIFDYENLLPNALTRNSSTLTALRFNTLPVEQFYSVVTRYTVLQGLSVNAIHVVGSEPTVSPDWVCQGLKHFAIRLKYGNAVDSQEYDVQQMD